MRLARACAYWSENHRSVGLRGWRPSCSIGSIAVRPRDPPEDALHDDVELAAFGVATGGHEVTPFSEIRRWTF